jgi:hypothetical protein
MLASSDGPKNPLGTYARTVSTGSTGCSANSSECAGTSTGGKHKCVCKSTKLKQTALPKVPKLTPTKEGLEEMKADVVKQRYALQSVAAKVLPGEKRLHECMRCRVPVASHVIVQFVVSTGTAHYAGLIQCGSVWLCPVCAAKVTEKRRKQLRHIVKRHIKWGGSVYMVTYTIQHDRYDNLEVLLNQFLKARRSMKAGRNGQSLRDDFGVFGTISVLEVTWSELNGWHVHVHELVFCTLPRMDEDGYEAKAKAAWKHAAAKQGLSMNEHGFRLDRTYGAVGDYIAKFGYEPARGADTWGVESEMTKGHMKKGRGEEHLTPFGILAAIEAGREDLKPVFAEYARSFKGHKQLNPSPGLYAFYGEEEKTDAELAEEHEEENVVDLVLLDDEQWAAVVGNDIRAELLVVARTGNADLVLRFLAGFGITGLVPPKRVEFADSDG